MSELKRAKSPCYGVCTLDTNAICIGCKRSQSEIREWSEASNERRLEILHNCRTRISQNSIGKPPIEGF
ncbi:MAG: DUF1289 domain-containing protein [Richelia sp. RM2_1_2]|nr:DUF1289 domain-containing protein [Richelia sp. RM2_1_2]